MSLRTFLGKRMTGSFSEEFQMTISLLEVDSENMTVTRVRGRNAAAAAGGVGVFGECQNGEGVHRQNHAKFAFVSGVRLSPEKFAAPGVFGWRCWHHRWAGE